MKDEEVTIPKWIFDHILDANRLAFRILESNKRETAADRQIEFAQRCLTWIREGKQGEVPTWIPKR